MEVARRTYKQYGVEARRLTLALRSEEWALLERAAARLVKPISYVAEIALMEYATMERDLLDERPGTYYDAQGREHEAGDVG